MQPLRMNARLGECDYPRAQRNTEPVALSFYPPSPMTARRGPCGLPRSVSGGGIVRHLNARLHDCWRDDNGWWSGRDYVSEVSVVAGTPLAPARPFAFAASTRWRRWSALLAVATAILALSALTQPFGPTTRSRYLVPKAGPSRLFANPCAVINESLVSRAFDGSVLSSSADQRIEQCTWNGYPFARQYGQDQLVVSLASATKAEFDRTASFSLIPGSPGGRLVAYPSEPVAGVGEGAYWDPSGNGLTVYYRGTIIYLNSVFLASPLSLATRTSMTCVRGVRVGR